MIPQTHSPFGSQTNNLLKLCSLTGGPTESAYATHGNAITIATASANGIKMETKPRTASRAARGKEKRPELNAQMKTPICLHLNAKLTARIGMISSSWARTHTESCPNTRTEAPFKQILVIRQSIH
jgi:hypothetical protein